MPDSERYTYTKSMRQAEFERSRLDRAIPKPLWQFSNSHLEHWLSPTYQASFKEVIPEGMRLRQYIETTLADRAGQDAALELGGQGTNLWGGFRSGFFKKTASIALRDERWPWHRRKDGRRNHTFIPSDLLEETTKDKEKEWRQDTRLSLIIERMIAGLYFLPNEPTYLSKHADYWYSQLSEGGLMFAQLPHGFYHFSRQWNNMMQSEYKDVIEVNIKETDLHKDVMRLRKLPGAPEHLPLLSARTVVQVSRDLYVADKNRKKKES